jgi:hypothetical protein
VPRTECPSPQPNSRFSGRLAPLSGVADPKLFVYGSLQFPEVLEALVGRVPTMTPDLRVELAAPQVAEARSDVVADVSAVKIASTRRSAELIEVAGQELIERGVRPRGSTLGGLLDETGAGRLGLLPRPWSGGMTAVRYTRRRVNGSVPV